MLRHRHEERVVALQHDVVGDALLDRIEQLLRDDRHALQRLFRVVLLLHRWQLAVFQTGLLCVKPTRQKMSQSITSKRKQVRLIYPVNQLRATKLVQTFRLATFGQRVNGIEIETFHCRREEREICATNEIVNNVRRNCRAIAQT
jgi:hypothetical protein